MVKAKAKLGALIDDVGRRGGRVTITRHGRPVAVLMSHAQATSLDATLEIMSDPEFYAEVLRNRDALDRGEGRAYDLSKTAGAPTSAVRRLRAQSPLHSRAGRPRRA